MKKHILNKKTLYAALSLLTLYVPYLLLGPMEIYAGNILAFKFSWLDFVPICIAVTIVGALVIGTVIALLPDKIFSIITTIITCLGFLSYIQAIFMNIKLVENDGNGLDFSSIGTFFYVNAIIWIAVIVIFVIAKIKINNKLWGNICKGLSAFLVVIQFVAFISLLATTPADPNKRSYQFDGEKQFELSQNDNILVFILDAYSNRFFDFACENNESFAAPLKDFTYYTNAESVYIPTFPAMPHMLTGGEFYFAESNDKWFSEIWHTDKVNDFYKTVHDNDYDFNLYTKDTHSVIGLFEDVDGKIDNAVRTEVSVDRIPLFKLITKMSAYRYVPYVIKPCCEVLTFEYDEILTYAHKNSAFDNDEYLAELKENGFSANSDRNVINITHIVGLHNVTKLDESIETQNELMGIIGEYVKQLKAAGLYDDATIIITADHGKWDYAEYQPIMFVKEKGETHDEMQRTNAPVSHDDFMPTILDLMGKNDESIYGKSIFDYKEDEIRKRTFNFISESEKTITSYEYEGDVEDLIDAMNEANE